jgi:hypothetical protein
MKKPEAELPRWQFDFLWPSCPAEAGSEQCFRTRFGIRVHESVGKKNSFFRFNLTQNEIE